MANFDAPVSAVGYSSLGNTLAIGLGGNSENAKCGTFVILNEEDLTFLYEARDSIKPISIVKFSPDGETLAVGYSDGTIYLYAVNDEYELIGRCLRHTSCVTHIDYSIDGEWLRSNSLAKELCFFSTDDASYQSNFSSMRDVEWSTNTCIYNWEVKSIHNSCWNNEIITSLHCPSNDSKYLACGTNSGYIMLYSNPCPYDNSYSHRFVGHIGEISTIRFTYNSLQLITSGSYDRSILQWKCSTYKNFQGVKEIEEIETDDFALEANEDSEIDEEIMPISCEYLDGYLNNNREIEGEDALKLPDRCNIWLENIVNPSNLIPPKSDIPAVSLALEYVYGYRSQDMRNNVSYTNNNNNIVFISSTIGVVMNCDNHSQKFYQHHTDRITAFAVSKIGNIIATGQMGVNPFISIWNTLTCETLAIMPDKHISQVGSLAFSNSSIYLAACTIDVNHTITVYDWEHAIILSRTYGGSARILSLAFSNDENTLCVSGIKDITFWSNITTRHPSSKKPIFGEIGRLQTFLCCLYFGNRATIATNDGHLYVFNEESLTHTVKAHGGSIHAISVNDENTILASGGKDGVLRLWNLSLECIKEITLDTIIMTHDTNIRSLSFSHNSQRILIGTKAADIFEVIIDSGLLYNSILLSSHGCRELWGLASHPIKDEFVTTGDDGTLRIWESKTFKLIKTIKVDTASRAVTYSPNGKYIAIGFGSGKRMKGKSNNKEGAFVVLTSSDHKVFHEGKDSAEPIRVIKFSSDGSTLVCGSDDTRIYIYNAKDHFSRKAIITCHKAPIVSIDFSSDGNFIMSVDSTQRIKYSEVSSGIEVQSPIIFRDEKWSTWTSSVGWPVKGFWMKFGKFGEDIVCAQRSCNKILLCAGTNAGRISLTHNPCNILTGSVNAMGHSGPVSQIVWMAGDEGLITIGRKDHTILQWKLIYNNEMESGDEGGGECMKRFD